MDLMEASLEMQCKAAEQFRLLNVVTTPKKEFLLMSIKRGKTMNAHFICMDL